MNRTGAPVQLLEVDYPDASFGADVIASGEVFHYRFQVRGSGPLNVTYTGADDKQIHITGPTLEEGQQGKLKIVLLPQGKTAISAQTDFPILNTTTPSAIQRQWKSNTFPQIKTGGIAPPIQKVHS